MRKEHSAGCGKYPKVIDPKLAMMIDEKKESF
jgi:hypothetical protein